MQKIDPSKFKDFLLQLQTDICDHLEQIDPVGKFKSDNWDRSAGGSGLSRVISGDGVFEKGGVNFSHVYGKAMPASASAQRSSSQSSIKSRVRRLSQSQIVRCKRAAHASQKTHRV